MGNYENLKQSITEVIRTNGNKEITGAVLQSTLLTIISTVGANATFAGIATPSTNPGTPDGPVFYLASESGAYSNFGNIELQDGLSVLMWNGSWSGQQIFGIDDEPTPWSNNLVIAKGIINYISKNLIFISDNLINKATNTSGYILNKNTGEVSESANYQVTDYIDVSEFRNFYIAANVSNVTFVYYNSSKEYISGSENMLYTNGRKVPSQNTVQYIRISYVKSESSATLVVSPTAIVSTPVYYPYGKILKEDIVIPQLLSYATLSDIAGLSTLMQGITVIPASPNLLDKSKSIIGELDSTDGTVDTAHTNYKTSDFFLVENKYNWYYCGNDSYWKVAFYDENKMFLYYQANIPYTTTRRITNQNVHYARVSYPSEYQSPFFYVQQQAFESAPIYVEYSPQKVQITGDLIATDGSINPLAIDVVGLSSLCLKLGNILLGLATSSSVSDNGHQLISIGDNSCTDEISAAIAIGSNALHNSVAGTNNDNGHYNVAIGHNSQRQSTTGNHNTSVGWGTMIDLTTGTGNTACGEDALCHTVTGTNNTAVGNRAMQTATGDNNVAIGSLAMYSNSQSVPNGSFNVAVGASSGCADTGDGDNNTAIGHGAGCSSQYRYTTTIGAGAHATKSRQVVIGSIESGTPHPLETILNGDIIVLGTDMIARKLVYNQDGSIGWTEVTLQ